MEGNNLKKPPLGCYYTYSACTQCFAIFLKTAVYLIINCRGLKRKFGGVFGRRGLHLFPRDPKGTQFFSSGWALGDREAETETSSLSLKAQKPPWRRLGGGQLCHCPLKSLRLQARYRTSPLVARGSAHLHGERVWAAGPARRCVARLTPALGLCSAGPSAGRRCTCRGLVASLAFRAGFPWFHVFPQEVRLLKK